jgi:peptide/nickel transport system permease protein
VLVRDLTVVQAGVLLFALVVMVTNLLVDLLYAVLDPRIRYS